MIVLFRVWSPEMVSVGCITRVLLSSVRKFFFFLQKMEMGVNIYFELCVNEEMNGFKVRYGVKV